jgi:hypothetical protein
VKRPTGTRPGVFRFRLITPGGEDIGPFVSSEPHWAVGSRLQRSFGEALVVSAVVPAEDGAAFVAYLVVEEPIAEPSATHTV